MRRLRKFLTRDIIPRRFTQLFYGLAMGAYSAVSVDDLLHSRRGSLGRWVWVLFLALTAVISLIQGATGFFTRSIRQRYDRRRAAGLCGQCGYDLRAAASVRCPECGAWHGATGFSHAPRKRGG